MWRRSAAGFPERREDMQLGAGDRCRCQAERRDDRPSGPRMTPAPHTLSTVHASLRSPLPDAGRSLLPDRRHPRGPRQACRPRPHHPWPLRPCPRRPWLCPRYCRDAAHHGGTLRRGLLQDAPGRRDRHCRRRRRRHRDLPSCRPRAGLRADRLRGQGAAHRRVRRLQARCGPDLRAVRDDPLRRLHLGGDLRATGVPPSRPASRDREASVARSRCSPIARISSARMRSARRSA